MAISTIFDKILSEFPKLDFVELKELPKKGGGSLIMGDTETGYVTIGYWPNSSPGLGAPETYAFLNYNDDLSQCTPSIKRELERTKINGEKMTQ